MLQTLKSQKVRARGSTFAIVAAKYNAPHVDAMVKAAQRELKKFDLRFASAELRAPNGCPT